MRGKFMNEILIDKNYIIDYLKEHKKEFMTKYKINKIALFGSYARGEETSDSDIDIIVDMPSSVENYFSFKYLLEEYFGKKVDLGKEKSLRLFIKSKIKNELIYV